MGFVLDIILIAIMIICIVYGAKKGFFKIFASLCSGIAALLCAYTFTPPLSGYIKDKFILDKVAESIGNTFASIAESGDGGDKIYDISKLFGDSQFSAVAERAGISAEDLSAFANQSSREAVEAVARAVAEPLARAVAEIVSFIIIFIVAFIAIRLAAMLIGLVFKLPVLRNVDKTMGVIFGIISALFFIWVFAASADTLVEALSGVAPSTFTSDMIDKSILIKFFAWFNPVGKLNDLIL